MSKRPSWREQDDFDYAKEGFAGSPDRCRKCHSAVWTLISRSGFREYLDPEFLTAADKLESYINGVRVFMTWRTKAGFEIDRCTPILFKADDGSRPVLRVHACTPNNIRKFLVDPYTLTEVTI